MSDMLDNKIDIIENQKLTNSEIFNQIRFTHKTVGNIKTPKAAIYKKMGYDYIKINYMKGLANTFYPGWSWHIISTELLGREWIKVHARLIFFDGVKRECDILGANRLQTKTEDPNKFVDINNDVKAVNTNMLRKAFNEYMDIGNDVYKRQDNYLTDRQVEDILKLAKSISNSVYYKVQDAIENKNTNGNNYEAALDKLNQMYSDKLKKEKEGEAKKTKNKP